jgi:hypothetical protein
MEKCSSILVSIPHVAAADAVLTKAGLLAQRFGAYIDVSVADTGAAREVAVTCAALGFGDRIGSFHLCGDESANDAVVHHFESRPVDLVVRHAVRGGEDTDLAARLPVPLLRVGDRGWRHELRLAVAIDASDRDHEAVARSILHAAGLVAMRCEASLDVLYSERETHDERVRLERAVRVARLVREFHIGGERLRMLSGPPEKTLPKSIAAGEYDIVVIGAVPRRPAVFRWAPSPTGLLARAAGDVMFVPETTRVSDVRVATPSSHDVTHP